MLRGDVQFQILLACETFVALIACEFRYFSRMLRGDLQFQILLACETFAALIACEFRYFV